jgi:hypothetical protein
VWLGVMWQALAYIVMKLRVPKEAGIRPGERRRILLQVVHSSFLNTISRLGAGPYPRQMG